VYVSHVTPRPARCATGRSIGTSRDLGCIETDIRFRACAVSAPLRSTAGPNPVIGFAHQKVAQPTRAADGHYVVTGDRRLRERRAIISLR
jgi:hypothetical protein